MADFEFEITETDSMFDLEEYINYLIIERCNEIYYKIISHNAEYQNLQVEIKSCFEELQSWKLGVLPESARMESVTERLSEVIGILEMLLPRLTYRQVLKDGVRVKGWTKAEKSKLIIIYYILSLLPSKQKVFCFFQRNGIILLF
jgi:hypothetical protein